MIDEVTIKIAAGIRSQGTPAAIRFKCEGSKMNKIQQVADAIAEKVNSNDDSYTSIAKAAIAAMREPTEEMLNAARDWSYKKYGKPIGNDAAIGCLQAMIDAALKE